MYGLFFKRFLDFWMSLAALIILSPILLIFIIFGTVMMKGNPFFVQQRPGKDEHIFCLIKFRSMTNKKDKNGNLLPDDKRLTSYGKWLRKTSCDELPELINILKGDMAVVGPRPQLVRDMVFMTAEQRKRHTVRPGLTGLAQCNGRNGISWEDKLEYDLEYIDHITLLGDIKIIFQTIIKVLQHDGISEENMETAADYGDYLLKNGEITPNFYDYKQKEAERILEGM